MFINTPYEEKYRGFTIKVEDDPEPNDPREWDNLGTMKKIRDAVRYVDSCNPPSIRSGGVWYKGIRPVLKSRMDKGSKAELIRLMLRQWVFSPGYEKDAEKGDKCAGILFEFTAGVCRHEWECRVHDNQRGHWMYACE